VVYPSARPVVDRWPSHRAGAQYALPSGRVSRPAGILLIGTVLFLLVSSVLAVPGVRTGVESPASAIAENSAAPPAHSATGHAPALPPYRLDSVPLRPLTSGLSQGGWLAYDPDDQLFYVADPPSSVALLSVNASSRLYPNISATVPVGSNPFGVAFDPSAGTVFVTNSGSDNVSVLNGTLAAPVANVSVGTDPLGVAFDPYNGDVYVANNGSDNVSVFNAGTYAFVASVPVPAGPVGLAVNASTGNVYVADFGADNLTVINGSTNEVVANVSVGEGPYGVAVDNTTGNVYVTDELSSQVSVVAGSNNSLLATIRLSDSYTEMNPLTLQGIAYDPLDGLVWVGSGHLVLTVISPANESVYAYLNFDPSGVAYDPSNGDICVTNTANATFECAQFDIEPFLPHYPVTFTETGLPDGSMWSVELADSVYATTENWTRAYVPNGTFDYTVTGPTGYATAGGTVVISGQPVSINITFTPASYYAVTFTESGLANGTPWGVTVGPSWSPAVAPDPIVFNLPNGTFVFSANATGYLASDSPASITVNGSSLGVPVPFVPAPYSVTFVEEGLPYDTPFEVELGGVVATGYPSVSFGEGNGTFSYTIGETDGYAPNPPAGAVTVYGGDVSLEVMFALWNGSTMYPVIFTETGLPSGTNWSVTLDGMPESVTGPSLEYQRSNGTYAYTVSVVPGFATQANGTLIVDGTAVDVPVTFVAATAYSLTFHEIGLPTGTGWGILIGSQVGSSLTANVTFGEPNGTYGYVILSVDGYETAYSGTVTVDGRDTVVPVEFRAQTFPIVFVELGLPPGSNWSVTVANASTGFNLTESSSTNAITVFLPNGTYAITFTLPAGFTGTVSSTQITVDGRAATAPALTADSKGGGQPPAPTISLEAAVILAVVAFLGATTVTFALLGRRKPPTP
jgi:YVTN family beta-propeller protein